MKLGAIKRCCVEEKEFYIYESDCGEQWIGTHTAAWPVEGDLKLTEGSIAAIFDLKPKNAAGECWPWIWQRLRRHDAPRTTNV